MIPCCNEKLFPFFRAGALQPDYFKSSRKIQQPMRCFVPKPCGLVPGPVASSVGLPSAMGDKAVPRGLCEWGCVCVQLLFFKKKKNGALFSGGDGLRWRGARGSPFLARKPDAWSHCLALPGKAGKASAGVIKQHAGAAGSEQAASEVPLDLSSRRESPWTANVAAFKPPKKSLVGVSPPWRAWCVLRWACTLRL